jgi:Ca2+:H+ antiporter
MHVPGLSDVDTSMLVREVAEIAATAATFASRERMTRKLSSAPHGSSSATTRHAHPGGHRATTVADGEDDGATVEGATAAGGGHGGHDAPNWSRTKSTVILLGATVLYAIIAEILVDTVDVVLENFAIDQKFLGITLFALVPNTTEFLVCHCRSLLITSH